MGSDDNSSDDGSSNSKNSDEESEVLLQDYESDDDEDKKKDKKKEEKEKGTASYATFQASSFKDFLLKPEIMRAIGDAGFEHPSEVQHNAIPAAMVGTDLICQAKSGMGKTAVFVISVLQQIDPIDGKVDTLVLAHVRELAFQICAEFDRFAKYLPNVSVGVVFGGIPFRKHCDMIDRDRPHIIVGTPGRTLHLIESDVLRVDTLNRFILDECDKLLDEIDMRKQVQEIFKKTPREKQVMVFSATIGDSTRQICRKITKEPQEIYIDAKQLTLHGLQQHYIKLSERDKNRKLTDLLDALDFNQVIIFVKTIRRAEQLDELLQKCAFPSMCIHGQLEMKQRLERFQKFKQYKCRIIVSSTLLGRGVDFERVNVIINYDMAENSDEYLHKVGRAGRFGTKGLAITFVVDRQDDQVLDQIQDRFAAKMTPMPDSIDAKVYMENGDD